MYVGYARVSTGNQNLESQIMALKEAGCVNIFEEKKSGKSTDDRTELANALKFLRKGDVFVVTRLDRVARSVKDLFDIINTLDSKGVKFKATTQDIDTTTPHGKLMLSVLGAVAEFETDLRAERQKEGIANAKAKGVRLGRPTKFSLEKVEEALALKEAQKLTNEQLAKEYNIKPRTLQDYIKRYKESKKNK